MRKIADQYDELMNAFLSLVGEFLNLKFVKENPALKDAVFNILNDSEIHQLYPNHRDQIIKITDFDPLDPIDQISRKKKSQPPAQKPEEDTVPSAPKVKEEGPDFDESSDGGEGPDFEELTEAPSDKGETPALSAPSETQDVSAESVRDKVDNLISQDAPAADIRAYAKELGVDVGSKANRKTVRKKIFEHFGIDTSSKKPKPPKSDKEVKTEEAPSLEEVSPQQEVNELVENEPEPEPEEGGEVENLLEEDNSELPEGSGLMDDADDELSDFDNKIYSPEMDKMLHRRGLEYPGWLVIEYRDGQITEEEGELLLEDYIDKKGLEDKKNEILKLFNNKIKKERSKFLDTSNESSERIKELEDLFDLKLETFKEDEELEEDSDVSFRETYKDEKLDEDPDFDLENDPDGDNAAAYITYNDALSKKLAEQLVSGYLEKNINKLDSEKIKLLKNKGVNSIVEYVRANLQMDKIQDDMSEFFFQNDIGPELKDKNVAESIISELANTLLIELPSHDGISKLIRELLIAESRKQRNQGEKAEESPEKTTKKKTTKKKTNKKKTNKKKEASSFDQDDYLVNKMSGLNCKRIKIWASEINSMGTQRVVVKVGWNKDAAEGVYPWNISQAIRTYIHSLEAANYVQDENLGLVGHPRIVGLDLDKCEAKVIVPCTNAESFPPMLVEGTAAVERRIKI